LYWQHLPAFLATGEPIAQMDDASQNVQAYQQQAAALGWMVGPAAQAAAKHLAATGASALDLGAGSAVWGLALAAGDAATTVTAVDRPAVLEVARQAAIRMGLADRLTLVPGDYHQVDLPAAAFDIAILANVTHLETEAGCRDLFARARAALKPRGRAVVIDLISDDPRGAMHRALYKLGLALRTARGRVHGPDRLAAWLIDAGFDRPRAINLDTPPHTLAMLVAQRGRITGRD
jgi:ubiquinone/menaquinone biosynthesis C-methylase UbiE